MPDLRPPEASDSIPHPKGRRQLIEILRWTCIAALVILIGMGLAWELRLAPLKGGTGALAFKVVPLCFAITGMLKHKLYTYRWMTLLIWLYFTEGIVRATGDHGMSQQLAIVEIVLSVIMFTACSVYVRLRLKVLPKKTKQAEPVTS